MEPKNQITVKITFVDNNNPHVYKKMDMQQENTF